MLLGQNRAEAILRSHLEKYGCYVELGAELRTLVQNLDYVTAHVVRKHGDEETTETIACRWMVGADGSHSELMAFADVNVVDICVLQVPYASSYIWLSVVNSDRSNLR